MKKKIKRYLFLINDLTNAILKKERIKDEQTIHDDVLYISQFGDIPSSRRACKLMNQNYMNKYNYFSSFM